MRRRVHNFIRAFVACATLTAIGAAQAAAPVPAARPIYFEHLTMRDGLSQSTVMSVLQDSHGYLWLATESGLDRYDGYSIRAYRRERGNERGLASDFIWTIAEDAHGDLWLATVGGGVARWDRRTDTFQQFRHDPAQARLPVERCGAHAAHRCARPHLGRHGAGARLARPQDRRRPALPSRRRRFELARRRRRIRAICGPRRQNVGRHRCRPEPLRACHRRFRELRRRCKRRRLHRRAHPCHS